MREFFDAIIIGGGPAGALAGTYLAQQGWSIAIIERGKRNRSKACGHCLSPRALPMLKDAGVLELVRTIAVGRTDRLLAHLPRRSPIELELSRQSEPGLLVMRHVLDQALLDHAAMCGALLLQPARAAITSGGTGPPFPAVSVRANGTVHLLRAPLIIGADGLRSIVAKLFNVSAHQGRKFGFSFDVCSPRDRVAFRCAPDHGTLPSPSAINMFICGGAYLGVVQQENGSLHMAALLESGRSRKHDPFAFCRDVASHFPRLRALGIDEVARETVSNFHAMAPMPWKPRTIAGPSFALVGDAAGYIEPFTGEGMCWAVQSAASLAEVTVGTKPGTWNAMLASRYQQLWMERIGRAQRRCAQIAWSLERPWMLRAAHRLALSLPFAAQRFAQKVVAA